MSSISPFTPNFDDSRTFFNKEVPLKIAKEVIKNEGKKLEVLKPMSDPVINIFFPEGHSKIDLFLTFATSAGFNYVAKFYEEYISSLDTMKSCITKVLEYDSEYCTEAIPKNERREYKRLEPLVRAEVCKNILQQHINHSEYCEEAPKSPSCKKYKLKENVLKEAVEFRDSLDENLKKVDSLSKSIHNLKKTPPLLEILTTPLNFDKRGMTMAWKKMDFMPRFSKRGVVWGLTGGMLSNTIWAPIKGGAKTVQYTWAGSKLIKKLFKTKDEAAAL